MIQEDLAMAWPCFLIEPNGRARHRVGRMSKDATCAARPGQLCYADALLRLDVPSDQKLDLPEPSDPAWPTACAACGVHFDAGSLRFGATDEFWRAPDGSTFLLRDAPVGSMWRATWFEGRDGWSGPDGHSYVVRLPCLHDWAIDGPSRDGSGWTRTGVAPKLTVTPSILVPGYHGFLRDGVLTDPC